MFRKRTYPSDPCRAMQVYTKKTGWVHVIKDDLDRLSMWLDVPGYTFYLAKYQEITKYQK